MKAILDRHAARLAPEERRAIWDAIREPRPRPRSVAAMGWPVPATAALGVVLIAGFLFTVQRRSTTFPSPVATPTEGAPEIESRTSAPEVVPPAATAPVPPTRERIARVQLPVSPQVDVPSAPTTMPPAADQVPAAPQVEEVRVTAQRVIDTKSSATVRSLRDLPVENLRDALSLKSGIAAQGGDLHVRGSRSGEIKVQIDGIGVVPPVVPTTGGERLPNDEAFDSMFFRNYGVNPFIATDEDPFSTFAVDVDAGSYTLARRYLQLGELPPADAVRVEEFVNFFPQDYPQSGGDDFRILIDGSPSPFGAGYHLVRVGLKGREIAEAKRKPADLVFVIDVSGSMAREDRLELVKRALRLLVDELRSEDRVGIVVYGSEGRVLLEPVGGKDGRKRLLETIEQLHPEGSTNAEAGLRLGYDMARRAYRPGRIHRIILCSDGVANVGATGPESVLSRVRTEADRGIQLTTIGFGMGNYNDVLMEQLADRGDGNHYYVDRIDEAQRVLVENLTGTLQTIARDAKVQVEFDSTRVLRYRLLGFENRDVADRDFRNDRVDAGEIGAGHEVTALYEVKLAPRVERGRFVTVRFRYAKPEQEGAGAPQVREIERSLAVESMSRRFDQASPRFRMDAAVAEFAEILRGSYWAKEARLSDVLSVARDAAGGLRDDATREFVTLVEKAAALEASKTRPKVERPNE